jgi:hypothetical protein
LTEQSNNIITFKNPNSVTNDNQVLTKEQIDDNIETMKLYHIQEFLATLTPMIFTQIEIGGFSLDDEDDLSLKDGAFFVEAIRSLLCKHYNIYHPFQIIAEATLIKIEEEENSFKIAENLNIILKEQKEA